MTLLALFSFRGKETNTVWPSLEQLSKRALIRDQTRLSAITKSLSNKGWLTKKKRGFGRSNCYELSIPQYLRENPILDNQSNIECNTLSIFDSSTNSIFEPESNSKEHTNEQTTEQKDRKRKPKKLDFSEYGVSDQIVKAFQDHRKAIKKPLTEHALKLNLAEAAKAPIVLGISADDAINETIHAGWQGVNIDWLKNRRQAVNGSKPTPHSIEVTGDYMKDNPFLRPLK